MTPVNPERTDLRDMKPSRLTAPLPAKARPRKGRAKSLTQIKMLITAASLATTVGGWTLMAQHDTVNTAQAATEQTSDALLVAQASPDATATLAQPVPTTIALAQATATATVAVADTATPQAAAATTTPQPAQPTATARPAATATAKTAVTKTRSSK